MPVTPSSRTLRAVLFDRDDTLAVTDLVVYAEAASWVAVKFGVETDVASQALSDEWRAQSSAWWELRTHEDEEGFWVRYGGNLGIRLGLDSSQVARLLTAFPYERFLKPVEGAREVLTGLRARGLRVGVLSNTLPSIGRTLEALGLADLVDVAVASCTVGAHKPDARAFEYALERLALPAGSVLFVDDRSENVEAARRLGMQAALIDLRGETLGTLHSLREVLDLVDGAAVPS